MRYTFRLISDRLVSVAKIGTACTTASPCVTTADTCTADSGSLCACATGLVANSDNSACCKYWSATGKVIHTELNDIPNCYFNILCIPVELFFRIPHKCLMGVSFMQYPPFTQNSFITNFTYNKNKQTNKKTFQTCSFCLYLGYNVQGYNDWSPISTLFFFFFLVGGAFFCFCNQNGLLLGYNVLIGADIIAKPVLHSGQER